MSEQQTDRRIDDEPTDERQTELAAAYQANIAQGKAPYAAVQMRTYGELLWIFEQRQWSGSLDLPEGRQHPNLSEATLVQANLSGADLAGANLSGASLYQANLSRVFLYQANLSQGNLEDTNLSGVSLRQANLSKANLRNANLSGAHLREANLSGAFLAEANLSEADLAEANLSGAYLEKATLSSATLVLANLTGAALAQATLSSATLMQANLSGAALVQAKFDSDTNLAGSILSSATKLGDIRWNGVDLTTIEWQHLPHLGDDDVEHPDTAARAYRQVATQLRSQGMNEVADRFAYTAQLWQRRIQRQRLRWTNLRSLGPYLGSLLLWAISGYGYRPSRTFVAYLLTVGSFAAAYYAVTHTVETQLARLSWDEALVLSLTSFHGRGFLPGFLALGDWVARIGALEAVIGLFIELILIATFSRRFLGN